MEVVIVADAEAAGAIVAGIVERLLDRQARRR